MKKVLPIFLSFALLISLLVGCKKDESETETLVSADSAAPAEVDFAESDGDMFTDRDNKTDYDEGSAVFITLDGNGALATSDSVKIEGSAITVTEEATYILSGSLYDGSLTVDAPEDAKLQLVFDGVSITSRTAAPICVLSADKVFITLADQSTNSLEGGEVFTSAEGANIDGALFSKSDLTLNGNGSLTVTSTEGHGIVCKDDLVITGGSYEINSACHGLDANDSVRIRDAELTVDAGKDIIHCENSDDASKGFIYIASGIVNGEAEGDGIAASAYLQIAGGSFDLLVGGGAQNGDKASSGNYGGFMGGGHGGMRPGGSQSSVTTTEDSVSMKGLKAASSMLISGGTFTIDSADDSVHSDASVTVNGGTFTVASGDDAFHAEDTLTVTAGRIDVSQCYEGLEALHLDIRGGDISITASDDGLNAAGGTDSSGTTGGRDGMFGGGPGGMGGGMSSGNGSIVISGGKLYINASGDGIDANGTLEISGGYTVVVGPTQGDTATLDYDKSAVITGGTFIGTGASGMAQSFSDSEQGVIAVSVGSQSAGTKILVKDGDESVILEYAPDLDFAVVIFSSPKIAKGETYSITVGSDSGETEAY